VPASNYPGIPRGGAAIMADATPLADPGVTLYAIDARQLAGIDQGEAGANGCNALLCNHGPPCLSTTSYWPIPIATAGVQQGASNVVVIGGCQAAAIDPSADATRCGPSWNPVAGNLHA